MKDVACNNYWQATGFGSILKVCFITILIMLIIDGISRCSRN
jgi:hypothetical protein